MHDANTTKIRLGLRLISGLGKEAGKRIEQGRPYRDVEDLAARAGIEKKELSVIAESGAIDRLTGGRRDSIWKVVGPRPEGLFAGLDADGARPALSPMSRSEQLVLDYERTGVSVADHPLKLLRTKLPKKWRTSQELMGIKSGTKVTTAGLVICRQRPGTASGVVFVTMEDEHGFANLVLWARVFEKFRPIATTARLLVVHGSIQRSDDPKGIRPPDLDAPQSVVYVMAEKLELLDEQLPALGSMSRDFH